MVGVSAGERFGASSESAGTVGKAVRAKGENVCIRGRMRKQIARKKTAVINGVSLILS